MKSGTITWFEIPVVQIDRAILFYQKVLGFSVQKERLTNAHFGIIQKDEAGIGGVLVEKENASPGSGVIVFFYVIDMTEALSRTKLYGGQIIKPKTIIKQILADGSTIIPKTLMDDNLGYYAEITDSEGNRIALHSNS